MAGGLAALLDDVAAIAKMASAAGSKAAAVVVDDAAVTPRYVTGFSPARELPMIARIARGSLVNKAILIVVLLALDHFLPVVLVPMLMLGGLYLVYEGAEKIWEKVAGHHGDTTAPAVDRGPEQEKTMVKGAIMTDFILSAEIMMISMNTINDQQGGLSFGAKALTMVLVAIGITALVYGSVALIVKTDDIGLALIKDDRSPALGKFLVKLMPKVLTLLSTVGVAAMLWVGGHILLDGASKLGWTAPYDFVHSLEHLVNHTPGIGGFLGWLVNTLASALVGLVIGAVIVGIMHLIPKHEKPAEVAPAVRH